MENAHDMASISKKLGRLLAAQRTIRGWSQREAAKRSEVLTFAHIQRGEAGGALTLERIQEFADFYNLNFLELIEEAHELDLDDEDEEELAA